MKFYCEQCNTKYSIAEEKVRGKVLKVRCKNCGNIITVRDPQSPAPTDAAPPKAAPATPPKPPGTPARLPQTNWYYSVNGQSSAPMDLSVLKAKYESGELGDETYVWHETIVQWKPVRDVDVFAESLAKGQVIKPRAKTVGFTGPLEAIKVADAPKGPQAGVAPAAQRTPESRPKLATPDPRPKPEAEPREDRLEKLREKLKNDVPKAAVESAPVVAQTKPEDPMLEATLDMPKPVVQRSATAELTFAPEVRSTAADLPSFDPKPVTSSTSNVFDAAPDDDDEPAADDSGLIPFFPDAPKLTSSMKTAQADGQDMSASLLIKIDELRDSNRRQKRMFVVLGVVGVAMLGGLIIFASTRPSQPILTPEPAKPTVARRAPVEKSYSKDKLKRFEMELGEEVIGADERAEDLEPEQPTPTERVLEKTPQVGASATPKTKDPNPIASSSPVKRPAEETQKGSEKSTTSKSPELTGRAALLAYDSTVRRDNGASINRPEDQLTATAARPKLLSKEEARKGFRTIRQSVTVCRERHMRRGATFAAKKIQVGITVQPDGHVSAYTVEPAEIRLTEFDTCMQSHIDRWKFAPWGGAETQINSSFVIQ